MRKSYLLLALILGTVTLFPVLAATSKEADEDDSSPAVIDDETTEKIKSSGKQALNDMKSAFQKASDAIDKQMKSISSKACVGKWKFTNGNCTTTMECLDDGSMEFVQSQGKSKTMWKGTYTSTSTEIQFHVLVKESKVLFVKKTDTADDYWTITYKVSGDEEMKLSSPELPHDDNGYDFSNLTLFIKE